jgi:hypothetical protein
MGIEEQAQRFPREYGCLVKGGPSKKVGKRGNWFNRKAEIYVVVMYAEKDLRYTMSRIRRRNIAQKN